MKTSTIQSNPKVELMLNNFNSQSKGKKNKIGMKSMVANEKAAKYAGLTQPNYHFKTCRLGRQPAWLGWPYWAADKCL